MSRTPERDWDNNREDGSRSPTRHLTNEHASAESERDAMATATRRSRSRMRRTDSQRAETSKRLRGSTPGESPPCKASRPVNKNNEDDPSNERLTRLELLVEKLVRTSRSSASQNSTLNVYEDTRKTNIFPREECVPLYDPQMSKYSVIKWLYKMEQLGQIHGWNDVTKIYLMQARLRGLAKSWYENLNEYDYNWEEWKKLLQRAFPEHVEYATALRRLLQREKLPQEDMATYYYSKMELLQLCEITGKKAVSCIIDGLNDPATQNSARAGRYSTPESLYEEYLSTLNERRRERFDVDGNNELQNACKLASNVVSTSSDRGRDTFDDETTIVIKVSLQALSDCRKDIFDDGVLTKEERLPKNEGTAKACQSKGSQRIVHLAQLRERALERIKFQQRLTKQRYDRKRAKPKSYSVGVHVLVRRERSSNDGASLMDLQGNLRGGRGVYPTEKLKPFKAGASSTDENECLSEAE
ncbi:hypothetical protein NQ315_014678 [Exocentrus adspersus]|uniref:Retrotransposon gag domain-containing protein n=1 Tax=Exocentrus adspersus TaxID=1586481 RepID=A0AAV8VR59_9CUCU|nr:hypothetical protein NQ315_014678 [Exocentrus adspersus]